MDGYGYYIAFTFQEYQNFVSPWDFLILATAQTSKPSSASREITFLCQEMESAGVQNTTIRTCRKPWTSKGDSENEELNVSSRRISSLCIQEIQLDVSISELSSSRIALNPNSFPGVDTDISSSAVWVVLILLSFTFRFSWYWVGKQND